ncbi:C cytochrome precursor [Roseiconus nitratireducens]|uniref:C cytochrome n=1 Tax=Roseiconus nitratireducens TaxID=2605748 RepID=A0A5M6D2Q4_9BACT|nr:multiheme c-type cytochrome [Roseiconus nitratireducens]KAA5541768.1 C cytochrome precursor [Roseiconus nitratireducens]
MKTAGWILAIITIAVVIFFFVLPDSVSIDEAAIERLQRQADQQAGRVDSPRGASDDRTPLPPNDMVVALVDDGDYWFIGKYEDGGGVEIPFPPGRRPEPPADEPPQHANPGYVGPQSCQECHPQYYQSFQSTAHYRTTRPCSPETIDGSFVEGQNVLRTKEPNLAFEMLRRDDQFFQRVRFFDWHFEVPMQIITGSSKMAQTYLYWHGDGLYQHNVTHLTEGDKWINSPGYIDGDAAYARPVPARCLDCHMTYFDYRAPPNHYTPNSIIFGVTCERCHGPGEAHVQFHQQHPEQKDAHEIVLPSELSRQRQLDICGQCHAGSTRLRGEPFQFRPGDELTQYYTPPPEGSDAANSVHTSNQADRMAESECFRQSEMTCTDCHNPHENERGNMRLFSDKCLQCHQTESCHFTPPGGIDLADNCIDCHMPTRPTEDLRLRSIAGDVFPSLRDHFVRVDQQATDEFLQRHQSEATSSQ